ncbi:MAG: ABC transporter substrate-binding protein, partial [Chloroflexota bacterium]
SPWWVDVPDYQQDLGKARALLAEAGYPNGLQSVLLTQKDERWRTPAEIIASQLKRAGIDLRLSIHDVAEHTRLMLRTHEFFVTFFGHSFREDPDDGYYLFLHSQSSANASGYADPEYDRLVEEARRRTALEERKAVYKKVVQKLRADVPFISAVSNRLPYAWRDFVKCDCAPGEENCWGFGGWFIYAQGGAKRVWLDK